MSDQIPSPSLHQLLREAARALAALRQGRNLDAALEAAPGPLRGGAQALAYAATRRLGSGQALLKVLVPKRPPPAAEALLLVALAQLRGGGQHADHTVVNQAVQAARQWASPQAALINAVLRRYLRERDSLEAALRGDEAHHEHPAWWVQRLQRDWPEHATALLAQAQAAPPFTLRVNRRHSSVEAYGRAMVEAGLQGRPLGPAFPEGLWVDPPCPVQRLPGFEAGWVSVQDASAQRAAPLLVHGEGSLPPLPQGARVLDACAAPGGKTAHLLELGDFDLLALDADAQRLRKVDDTLRRLRLKARTQAADARDVASWWDGRPFDAILLDAPCSASGINRRHPDVRWLRRESDLAELARIQAGLLDALWPTLAPGGRLLYATCSLFAAEGRDQVAAFLQRQPEARLLLRPGIQGHLLGLPDNPADAAASPGLPPGDGFFYALFQRCPPTA
ncbi:MAG: 16S rRNA (cytosine(967)-C(5))-methyltransferase RsmB [Inhella sp.]|jgi:16S rRNA (cytosine967-C5)-methyltransferase|uniref:16S rRNA (cytosine(967)-C(5))-methyltransferase RsmB n=1 Tax=Inhella sp. TaxID=1921806 RepID=UPI0022CB791B|nr:16S rRNA (cytosine(967)-C(5))-methyltransferase RsmB [Inhella sp.]MCZ8236619.1 16S rRNA (cytosine(967)-C(5))-methyltransferase RsmB [Inhella sp.]